VLGKAGNLILSVAVKSCGRRLTSNYNLEDNTGLIYAVVLHC